MERRLPWSGPVALLAALFPLVLSAILCAVLFCGVTPLLAQNDSKNVVTGYQQTKLASDVPGLAPLTLAALKDPVGISKGDGRNDTLILMSNSSEEAIFLTPAGKLCSAVNCVQFGPVVGINAETSKHPTGVAFNDVWHQ